MSEAPGKIREGDLRALARLATGIENRDPEALADLHELERFAGHARIVGITGPPGAGKSTLVDALAPALRRRGHSVAALAVDPSSRITGGAILGDRIRMMRHHADSGIFIRSMATRGSLGGLAEATRDMAVLMDAAGRDYILIETVGVGQDEVEIAGLAGITVVVLAPGMGDEVQAIKAGIMEIADIFVINKADQPGADRAEQELRAGLAIAAGPHPPILRTVATEGQGIDELLDALAALPCRTPGVAASGHSVAAPADFAARDLSGATAFYAAPGLRPTPVGVPDLAAAAERIRASGGRLLNQPAAGAPGHLYVFMEPLALLELIQEDPA